ncbi:AAA family ATPase [Salinarimonas soli]|uniref:AAA family ATPase n=1 Tax=Salinarimonas soli TaxID=1638099 RepID=A0A5B2V5A3_9HYPH|nr:AAA family ATPase [Salinarimonas soli]KAA2234101.1 AAA family ATPase [Salinarimonas soli]
MIEKIKIEDYKSIKDVEIALGRINVFVGENGAGKSNVLEAIALAGAASAEKLDNEFLASRGIRLTEPQFMRPMFKGSDKNAPITVTVSLLNEEPISYILENDNSPYSHWTVMLHLNGPNHKIAFTRFSEIVQNVAPLVKGDENFAVAMKDIAEKMQHVIAHIEAMSKNSKGKIPDFKLELNTQNIVSQYIAKSSSAFVNQREWLSNFVIFSPENSALREFEREGQIEPLGINGEGLFKLLAIMAKDDSEAFLRIKNSLAMIGWFADLEITESRIGLQRRISVKDQYIGKRKIHFDQRSTNEGFMFLIFYFTLLTSKLTPTFFAIDNIDASLNPKLCTQLMQELVKLAAESGKQVLLTTHNPAVLDGLNLDDDDQRLFIISRARDGQTEVRRFLKPPTPEGMPPVKLSEAFLRGAIGGLPKNF